MWRRVREESGAAAVEFALVLTILVAILLGITQFGMIFFHWLEIEHAAREGARWAATGNADGSVATPGTVRYKVWEAAPGLAPRLVDASITISPSDHTLDDFGEPVTVTVVFETPIFTPFMARFIGGGGDTLPLRASATQMIEAAAE